MKGLSCNLETSKVPVIASIETVVAAIIGICISNEAAGLEDGGICCVVISILMMNMIKPKKRRVTDALFQDLFSNRQEIRPGFCLTRNYSSLSIS